MYTRTGYLTAVLNPNFSGLATVKFRSRRKRTAKRPGRVDTCYCEAGFGVRQLVAALSSDGYTFTQQDGEKRCRYTVDDLGLLQSVEPLE